MTYDISVETVPTWEVSTVSMYVSVSELVALSSFV